ncbi:unnamed protein product [Rotaria sordida]|uniref:Uncharacterized protein n=1 Tax=Rotaria sordida TaxID=392033 RepID=A0A814Q9Z9_9BILA|nr:unnamed protein product [Rotaria sordida]CAF3750059.1 unnamed protein product [Rotaria sordida]
MGNTNNKVKGKNKKTPVQQYGKNQPVLGSVNGYNYYPNQYAPEQYFYPAYPPDRPVVSSEQYLQNEFFPTIPTNNDVVEQYPSAHHSHVHHSHSANKDPHPHPHHRHHQHNHTSDGHNHHRSHHHHHHHHHSSSSITENEISNPSIVKADATSSRPLVEDPPSLQTKNPITPVTYRELVIPSPAVESTSVVAPKSQTPVIIKQQPPPRPLTMPLTVSSSLPVTADNFENAPILVTNHVLKSSDKKSIHTFGSDTVSIVKRTQSQPSTPGGRWYEHNYDKRITPLTTKYV